MFINTSNRFTKFYRTHKTSIDTLLLILQLIAMAIALLGLLSILGWALAISQAVAWMNKLVEDSLAKPRLLMPATDKLDTQSNDVPNLPNADAILAEWQDKADAITHMQSVVEYAETHNVPDWYKEAIALATDALNVVDGAIAEVDDRSLSEEMGQTDTWIALSGYTIRELKKMASEAKIKGYPKMTKAKLILALA